MRLVAFLAALLLLSACGGSPDYSPKPRGYYRIHFPKREYQDYSGGCPFTFTYPKYAFLEPDRNPNAKPCWINMQFPGFKGTLHLTYWPVTKRPVLDTLIERSHFFAYKHTIKATSIVETPIDKKADMVFGLYYAIDGNAASSAQFFLTDTTHHFLRGALYFNSEPKLDSIQPVLNFVKKDVDIMIKSFKWKH